MDPRTRLIETVVRDFAKAARPGSYRAAAADFQWAFDWSREAIRAAGMRELTLQLLNPAAPQKTDESALRSWQFARAVLLFLALYRFGQGAEGLEVDARNLEQARKSFLGMFQKRLRSVQAIEYYVPDRDGLLRAESIPLWNSVPTCVTHAMALLVSDYRGLRGKVSICPYTEQGDPPRIRISKNVLETSEGLHFLVDARGVKGQPMLYCSPRHQRAHWIRKHRAKAKQGKSGMIAAGGSSGNR